ncbi:MAG: tRNA (adenosine(37)-N6)-dimethylallyltransferase MiaA [bacterium]|nr:tRNA (adenosine(37)-N6)-dimethylallyltransferase MiaA [bacterium]
MNTRKTKIIAIVGSTASGKSDLAVYLAKKIEGEIISADSRQVYKTLNIGTAKISKRQMKGIKHHLLDIANPKNIFTGADFKKHGEKALEKIIQNGNVPIVCGGTGFYLHLLLNKVEIPEIEPNWVLRKKLEKKTTEELFQILKKNNPKRAENIDSKNPRRLIRAIEIASITPKTPDITESSNLWKPDFNILWLGIKPNKTILKNRIEKRIKQMFQDGLSEEVRKMRKNRLTWKRIEELGFEYKYPALYLRKKISKKEMVQKMILENNQYAKRQMTWFNKYAPKTRWLKTKKEALNLAKKFLS